MWSAVLQGKFDDALVQGRKTVELAPDSADARLNLGIVLWQLGSDSEAMEHLEVATRLAPEAPRAHYHLGIVLDRQQQVAQAAEEFEQALKCQDDFFPALVALACVRALAEEPRLRNPMQAVALAEKACALSPAPEVLNVLATAYAAAGRLSDAISTTRRALDEAKSSGADGLTQQLQQNIREYERQRALNGGHPL